MENVVTCGHPESPYYAKGMCRSCYRKYLYSSNPEFREREKKRMRETMKKFYKDKKVKDPDWNAKRQREFRKRNPETFIKLMAKHYLKKMTPDNRRLLLCEIEQKERDENGRQKGKER